ncbi:Ldh family oxidoreductase [Ruegeria arenilitoris]|uniref:Ldh family oxidoreductase n=1 Tax=Ruegeria arenilitoris TaxID=1173585 RepID=UPI00147CED8B|nr:Ldh family oxidoreductase [Ruegeria arenilitoris]
MANITAEILSLDQIREIAITVLTAAGMDANGGSLIANIVTQSERDGLRSHGLRMLPFYVQSFQSGYANPVARPLIERIAPGVLRGDGDNGYYQIAAALAQDDLAGIAQENGIAAFTCANCHHLAALRFDTESFAEAGLIALMMVNSLSMVVPQGGVRPVFGTNPMSFACPRKGMAPVVWDQASSMMALMDIKLAAAEGRDLPRAAGLDSTGQPSTDPKAILETCSLLPFGEHKGAAIAFLVEVLGAALAGGALSVDNADRDAHGALNIKGGSTLIVIDPARFGNASFDDYLTRICAEIEGNGDARVPGDGRLKHRAAADSDGVAVSAELISQLRNIH